jgi:tetratricopeptide (TPR) repeat protein
MFSSLQAQYDEKEILFRRANQLSGQRQFERANQIYVDLIQTYPGDFQIIDKLIHNYMVMTKLDAAEKLLEENKMYFPEINYLQKKLAILLTQGKIEHSEKLATEFLQKNKTNIAFYQNISSIFEAYRQYEIAIKYYLEARRITKDETLFSRELSTNFQFLKKYEQAIEELLRFLQKNNSFKNYAFNNLKTMYDENKTVLVMINQKLKNTDDVLFLEIQALLLAHAKNYEEALAIYQKLEPSYLLNFANQQYALTNLEIALSAYLAFIKVKPEIETVADVKVKIARLYMLKQDFETAKQYLGEIYGDEKMQSNRLKYKTRANKESRELLAEIAIIQDKPKQEVLGFFKDAKQFAMNLKEQYELEFRMVHYQMMIGDEKESETNLGILFRQQERGTAAYKMSFYHKFLLSVLHNREDADSLLAELTINIPETDETRQALQLSFLRSQLSPEQWNIFIEAFKKKELFHLREAIIILEKIAKENEYVQVLAADWVKKNQISDLAKLLFSKTFTDEDLKAYALLRNLQLDKTQGAINKESIIEFLKLQPNSFLSANLRNLLNVRE